MKQKKHKMNMKIKKMEVKLFVIIPFLVLSICSCKNYKLINKNISNNVDSGYNFTTYLKRDSTGHVTVMGQFLNGKKDGAWRYFSNGKLIRTNFYFANDRILETTPELEHTFQTYQIYLPDSERKTFSYKKNILKNIETFNNNNWVKEEFNFFKKTDTLIINKVINDSTFFGIITNKKNSFYQMTFLINDSSTLFIDVTGKKFQIR